MSNSDLAAGFVGGIYYGQEYPDLMTFDPMKYMDPTVDLTNYSSSRKRQELALCSDAIMSFMDLKRSEREERIDDLKHIIWYSMVICDEEKHQLNKQKAYEDLGMDEIFYKYL